MAPLENINTQLQTPDIDPVLTGRLARSLHRRLLTRLAAKWGVAERTSEISWLAPRAIWLAITTDDRDLSPDELCFVADHTLRSAPAPLRVLDRTSVSDWHVERVRAIQDSIAEVNDESDLRIADESATGRRTIETALGLLEKSWPQARIEFSLLIRELLLLERTELSASMDQSFGLIYLGTHNLRTIPHAVEVVLHETGHHSLYLRQMFTRYLENPEDIAQHPLRHDPRPLSGILHAAHVLWRMTHGLHLVATHEVGSPWREELARLSLDNARKLTATLDVLREHAAWTPDGRVYFEQLCTLASPYAAQPSGA